MSGAQLPSCVWLDVNAITENFVSFAHSKIVEDWYTRRKFLNITVLISKK